MDYPIEILHPDSDNGTITDNVKDLQSDIIGHRIISTDMRNDGFYINLDNGTTVLLRDSYDCCASTELQAFFLNPELIDHVIMGVGTTEEYTQWHIYADLGDILTLTVEWSCGNPFYYGYGFSIDVIPTQEG